MGNKHNMKNKRKKSRFRKADLNAGKNKPRNYSLACKQARSLRKKESIAVLDKHSIPKKPTTKKRPYQEHEQYFMGKFTGTPMRTPNEWEPKTYSLYRQRLSYLQWVLCKYHVPAFLLDTFIESVNRGNVYEVQNQDMFREWAQLVGTGGSLYKNAKGLLTKKECHHFLNFKGGNVVANIWRARCVRAKLNARFTNQIVSTLVNSNVMLDAAQWIEFIDFVGKNQEEFEVNALIEIMDFIRVQWAQQIRTLKDRTVSSLTRMSNEWHQVMSRTKTRGGSVVTWPGLGIGDWHVVYKDDPTYWFITEILDSRDLYTEGNKLRHCVGSYTHLCTEGRTHIFSLRHKDYADATTFYRHATIEVQDNQVHQARRRMNRPLTSQEKTVMRRWASENNITIHNLVFW